MKVLVTGSDGYLGALTAPYLRNRGHEVVGLDTGFFREGWLYNPRGMVLPETLTKDIREVTADDLAGVDAVVHMGELSNDPLGELSRDLTYAVNHRGSVRLADVARSADVQRFVHMSSCSVYGVAEEGEVDESSPVRPQTAYAECKALVERDVSSLAGDEFSPTFLRNATAFGASPRQRFDIVLNNLCGVAWTTGEIVMTSDGTPWRPLVHALDIAKAIACVLDAPRDAVHDEVFNVGDAAQNYQVKEIAEVVAATFPGCGLRFGAPSADNRSYRVNFDKINTQLPGFRCEWDAERGARQLHDVLAAVDPDREAFAARPFTRLAQLRHLIATSQLDTDLFWTAP